MSIALSIYAAVYMIAITVAIVDNLRSKGPLWDTASDVILLPLGLVGIFLYGLGITNPEVKLAWKLVAPILVVGQVAANVLGRYRTKKRVETEISKSAVLFSDIVTTILLLPMFLTNLAFAFR